MKENYEIVQLLLSNDKIDVNVHNTIKICNDKKKTTFSGRTALHAAVKSQNVEIVRLLLSNDTIDVNAKYTYIFDYADEILADKGIQNIYIQLHS